MEYLKWNFDEDVIVKMSAKTVKPNRIDVVFVNMGPKYCRRLPGNRVLVTIFYSS
jgi:hypothetical protein